MSNLRLAYKPGLLLAAVASGLAGCQQVMAPAAHTYQDYGTRPRFVRVTGQFFASFDTTKVLRGYRVLFTRELADRSVERVEAARLSDDGFYQVRVRAGKTYQVDLLVGNCPVETIEYTVSNRPQDSVVVNNFYLPRLDSTDYGGCLAGWHPQLVGH